MKRIFQFSLLLMVATYLIGDLVATIRIIYPFSFSAEGNLIPQLILVNFGLNIFVLSKILATIIGCFALIYCYKKGFPLTATISSIVISIVSVMTIINNSFATVEVGDSFIFYILAIILIPVILLVMESLYKEKRVKLPA